MGWSFLFGYRLMGLIFSRAAIILFLITLASVAARAAEVECLSSWDRKEPFPEEPASKFWPSGFRPTIGMCIEGYIHGTILKGDYEKVREIFRKSYRTLSLFTLWSPGGDVGESIKIGTLMRNYLMTAYAPRNITHNIIKTDPGWNRLNTFVGDEARDLCTGPECVCASACALIWFGAVERRGFVGLHRPRIDDPMFKALGPADAAKAYKGVLEDIARYMAEMEVPRPMLDAMVATGSSEVRWVYSDDENLERRRRGAARVYGSRRHRQHRSAA
jgi:hypothetical protein